MSNSLTNPMTSTARPPLLTRGLLLRFVSVVGSNVSFFLLLSAVPVHAGRSGAGLATGSLMLSTVLGELAGPRILGRYGSRGPLAAGLLLLGAPALALSLSDGPAWTATVCGVRGLGFGLSMVAGGALTAALIPGERRGEGIALVGLVGGVPSLVALPLGVWLSGHIGYTPVTAAAALAALMAIPTVRGLREQGEPAPRRRRRRGLGPETAADGAVPVLCGDEATGGGTSASDGIPDTPGAQQAPHPGDVRPSTADNGPDGPDGSDESDESDESDGQASCATDVRSSTSNGGPVASGGRTKALGVVGGLRAGGLRRPTVVFGATAVAAGILVTFLPLAVPHGSGIATVALLVQSTASTAARWVAGRYGDRRGPARLVVPGLLVSAAGLSTLAAPPGPVAVLAGAAVFGTGFGIAQNATLTLMYSRVSRPSYGTVTALWNLAYDGGMGVGAAGFGLLAAHTGYGWGFGLTGLLMLGALAPAVRDRRSKIDCQWCVRR
ncbi:MFS transporter [Streptomyces sp. NPDC004561]